jgi:deoxyribodipyrimidine photolyase
MTDSTTKTEGEMGSSSDDTFTWTEPEQTSSTGSQKAQEWLSQLQGMIENLATQAAPVVREVGAKAAELAAMAGEKAGPLAQRAAVFTENAGHKIAERSRDLAVDLRNQAAAAKAANTASIAGTDDVAEIAPEPMTADESTSMADERTTSGVA